MKLETLQELFVEELKDLYSAENQLVKALPKMAKAASSQDLKAGFEEHLRQTEGHVARIERVCQGRIGIRRFPQQVFDLQRASFCPFSERGDAHATGYPILAASTMGTSYERSAPSAAINPGDKGSCQYIRAMASGGTSTPS